MKFKLAEHEQYKNCFNLYCDGIKICQIDRFNGEYISKMANEYEELKFRLKVEQDKRVKAGKAALEFQKENKKLKEELEKAKEYADSQIKLNSNLYTQLNDSFDENEKLKEELKELKKDYDELYSLAKSIEEERDAILSESEER